MKPILSASLFRKKIFVRNFCLTLILVLILLGSFSVYIYSSSSRAFSQQQTIADEAALGQYAEQISTNLQFLSQLAAAAASGSDIVNAVILPGLENRQRNLAVVSALKSLKKDNDYIDEVFLYERVKYCVYSSDSLMTALNSFTRGAMIRAAGTLDDHNVFIQKKNLSQTNLVKDGKKLYLAYNFLYSNDGPMGCLILVLNTEHLLNDISSLPNTVLKKYAVRVHGLDQHLVYSSIPEDTAEEYTLCAEQSMNNIPLSCQLFARDNSIFSVFRFGRELFPILIPLLLISLGAAYLISCRIYAPLQDLTTLVVGEGNPAEPGTPRKNEYDDLTSAYQKLISDNNTFSSVVDHARPELERELFQELLNGMEISPEDVERRLRTIHSAFRQDEKTQVLLTQIQKTERMDALEVHIYHQALIELAKKIFRAEYGNLRVVSMDSVNVLCVLQYPHDASAAQIKNALRTYQQDLKKETDQANIPVLISAGKLYKELNDLDFSWKDAKEQLHYTLYYQEDTEKSAGTDIGRTKGGESYLDSEIRRFREELFDGQLPVIQSMLKQLMKGIFSKDSTFEEMQRRCESLLNIFIERLLTSNIASSDSNEKFASVYQQAGECEDVTALKQFMEHTLNDFMSAITADSQKRQNRLIHRAKEFIAANYSSSNLSINEIAADIGCSASYLSSIFTEYTHENLVSYLNSYRINMAKELLVGSQILIKDVGFRTGFNTVQNFNRVFKKETGMTPNEYRRQNQKF